MNESQEEKWAVRPVKGRQAGRKIRAHANLMTDAERLRHRVHSLEVIRGRELTIPELMIIIDATAAATDPKTIARLERQFVEGFYGRG